MNGQGDEARRNVRRIVLRASLYAWGFLVAAILVALGGSALLAWLLTRIGLPFVRTWITVSIIVLLPSLIGIVWRTVRDRNASRSTAEQRD